MGPKYGPNESKSGVKLVFSPFSQVSVISFLEIAYNDSLQQFLTSNSRDKTHQKVIWGPKFGPKVGPKLGFSAFSQF